MRFFLPLLLICAASVAQANPAHLDAVNTIRAEHGKPALNYDKRLYRAARAHNSDMIKKGFFSHTGSNGSSVGSRVTDQGFKWCYVSENIAKGQTSLTQVMQSWMNSPGHRKNILSDQAQAFGLQYNPKDGNNSWVMVLAKAC